MIYLITLNPAIDEYVEVDNFKMNITNFSSKKTRNFGGKAINVGKIVNEFTKDYEIITTLNEQDEQFIKKETRDLNINFFKVEHVRENIKINDNSNITEINEAVKKLDTPVMEEIKKYIINKTTQEDIILFAGSVHKEDVKEIVKICSELKTDKIIVDSASFTLEDLKAIKPYMIKPNAEEVEKLLGSQTSYKEEADELIDFGISNVIISLGGKGSYYKSKDHEFSIPGIKGDVVNTVGAGDSYVGGFIVGTYNGYELTKTLKLAAASGSATAFSNSIAKKDEIEEMFKKIEIL